ncbi:MAG: hypothetical protein HUU02_01655 [Bacteroidetes bacterium]|nr:hypothetical protein [Bacteroidota bacterium]
MSINVITAVDPKLYPHRKLTKKQLREIQKIREANIQKQFELDVLQFHAYNSIELGWIAAIKLMTIAMSLDKQDIVRAFNNAYEHYSTQIDLIQLLKKHGVPIVATGTWFNPKFYNLTKKDFFKALSPEIQHLLREKGVNYDE